MLLWGFIPIIPVIMEGNVKCKPSLTLLSVGDDLKEIWGGHASYWWDILCHFKDTNRIYFFSPRLRINWLHSSLVWFYIFLSFYDENIHKSWEILTLQWPVSDWGSEISPRRAPKWLKLSPSLWASSEHTSRTGTRVASALRSVPCPGARFSLPGHLGGSGPVIWTNKRPWSSCRRQFDQSEAGRFWSHEKTFLYYKSTHCNNSKHLVCWGF